MLIRITSNKDDTSQKFRPGEIIHAVKKGLEIYEENVEFKVVEVTKAELKIKEGGE